MTIPPVPRLGQVTVPISTSFYKQIRLELPKAEVTFFSKNALQFVDLITAEEFLFGLMELQRASINHLRQQSVGSESSKSYLFQLSEAQKS